MKFEDNPARYEIFKPLNENPKVIVSGDYSQVLALSNCYVAKVPIEPHYNLNQEYETQVQLYSRGLPVARPLGIFRFSAPSYGGEFAIGLIMDFLQGIRGNKTPSHIREKVKLELETQLEKCRQKGFETFDEGLHNCIWNPEQEKLYLIDFLGWKKIN